MAFQLDKKNLKVTGIMALAAFLLTQNLNIALVLAIVNIVAAGLL